MVHACISPSRSLRSIAHFVCISAMMLSEITTVRLHQSSSLKPAEPAHFYIYKKVLKPGLMTFFFLPQLPKLYIIQIFVLPSPALPMSYLFAEQLWLWKHDALSFFGLFSWVYHVNIKQEMKPANNKQSTKQSHWPGVQATAGLKHIYRTLTHPYTTNNTPNKTWKGR